MSNTTLRSLAIIMLVHVPLAADAQPGQPQPPPVYPEAGPPVYPQASPPYQPVYAPPPAEGPEEITEFDEARPIPYGYTKVTRTRKGLVIGGSVTFGVTYGVAMVIAAVGEDLRKSDATSTNTSALWYPVVGPFLQIKQTSTSIAQLSLFHFGLAQIAGATMLVYGLTSPRTLLVRNDQLSISPMIGNGASGMMVAGRF